ncbi:MAG: hypothetical protein KDA37_12485, partial [Planctomycetales bacterium]|nr:hypothetical protein [Planctomycetales bacterium]
LGPLLALAGYPMLRDAELEPYRGGPLWLRAIACGLAFAAAWGVYCYVGYWFGGGDWPIQELSLPYMLLACAFAIAVGTVAALASLDLDPTMAAALFALYFVTTIVLRLVIGLAALPGFSP